LEKVTYVSVASNYNRKDGETWKTDTHWNSVVCFGTVAAQVGNVEEGDLVHITGRVRENSHSGDNGITTRLILSRTHSRSWPANWPSRTIEPMKGALPPSLRALIFPSRKPTGRLLASRHAEGAIRQGDY
jgi:hypothetical protein